MTCPHENFTRRFDVHRITDGEGGPVRNYFADIAISCTDCGLPFHFVGLPSGLSFTRPMVSVDATEMRAPIAPGRAELAGSMRFEGES